MSATMPSRSWIAPLPWPSEGPTRPFFAMGMPLPRGLAPLEALDRKDRLLFLAYAFLLLGFFYIPNTVDLYKYYSIVVLPLALWTMPRIYPATGAEPLLWMIVAYLVYMLATPAWGEDFSIAPYLNYARLAVYVVTFVMTTAYLNKSFPSLFEALMRLVALAAAVAALISIGLWVRDAGSIPGVAPYTERILGIGVLEHPNTCAFVYGFFGLVNLHLFLKMKGTRARWLHGLAALVLLAFVVLTQSRGGLLATTAGITALFVINHTRQTFLVLFGLAESVAITLLYQPDFLGASSRGTSSRLLIWETVWENIRHAPWFGHGYLTEESVYVPVQDITHAFAHDVFLGTLRDGGLVGLALLLMFVGLALWRSLSHGRRTGNFLYFSLLVFGLVCMTFDLDRLLTRPRELWIIFWLPLALTMGLRARTRGTTGP